jgi:pyruvate,water dikinase
LFKGLNIFKRRSKPPVVDELKKRHFAFKELLHANNEALRILADLEGKPAVPESLTTSYMRSRVVALTVNVCKIVRNLETVSGKEYPTLHQTLERRVRALEKKLAQARGGETREYVIPLTEIEADMRDSVGAKTANLAEMKTLLGLSVPDGFVLTTRAYERFYDYNRLEAGINTLRMEFNVHDPESVNRTSRHIKDLIYAGGVPPDLEEAIRKAYAALEERFGPGVRLAVRSSAIGEDSVQSSFAGLYESCLNVSGSGILHAYKQVLASKYTTRALYYKAKKGLADEDIPMCVCCIRMVDAVISGVMYTQDPFQPGRVYISAGWGLGPGIVAGEIQPDTFLLEKETGRVLETKVSAQATMLVPEDGKGIREVPVPRLHADEPCLDDKDLAGLFRVAGILEGHYQGPQDVEFSIDEAGALHLLQTRALDCSENSDADEPQGEAVRPEGLLFDCPEADVACRGAGAGVAHVVREARDMERFPPVGVLVVRSLMPDWMELVGRVKAIVTEVGSPTGHMASIAREFKVPMLVNVKDATRRVPEGEWVTLDASGRALYLGQVESLINSDSESLQIIRESPVYKTLEAVLASVSPLNLTNPRDRNFRPAGCRTLHDIMRFCHEESINAMFSFSDSPTFQKGKVFQLSIPVPLRIFVVDLGRGLTGVDEGRREIRAEHVASAPFRAVIDGMTTPGVRWAGHVPLGFKSLVSVFANTLYDPMKHERELGARSYGIVSNNYVNFSSRLGYHFSTLDAYCGEEPNSNYISFRFKGGAASVDKRQRRAEFIARILVANGFWMDQKEDLVNAMFKNFPMGETLERLVMLGRLMGCARQLDVAMESAAHVSYFVDLFLQGKYNFFSLSGSGDGDKEKTQ